MTTVFGSDMAGVCAMRGSCGTKGWFGASLPCPYDGPPEDVRVERRILLYL